MRVVKVLLESPVWEEFFRLFPEYGRRSQLLREFIYKRIAEETLKRNEKEKEDE